MLRNKVILSLIAGAITTSVPAFSQEENPAYKNEVSVQASGSFVKTTTSNGVPKRDQQWRRTRQLSILFQRAQWRGSELRLCAEHTELPFSERPAGREDQLA